MTKPRPERLPHPAKVQHELARLMFMADRLNKIAESLAKNYLDAYDAGLSPSSNGELPTLGRGFQESDPTGQTALNNRLKQLKWRVSKAAQGVTRAIEECEEAQSFLDDGFLHLDEAGFARWVMERPVRRP